MLIIPFNVVYVDGQDIATKLSKQITQRTNSIRSSVVKYNAGLAFWNDQFEGLQNSVLMVMMIILTMMFMMMFMTRTMMMMMMI